MVERHLDLRCLTDENQNLIEEAVLGAVATEVDGRSYVDQMAEMIRRARNGEAPLSMSHWTLVIDAPDEKIGPGWTP